MIQNLDFYSNDWVDLPVDPSMDRLDTSKLAEDEISQLLNLEDILDVLREPGSLSPLVLKEGVLAHANNPSVPRLGARIALLPSFVRERLIEGTFEFQTSDIRVPGTHYALISDMKARGDNVNLDPSDPWYQRHLFRARSFFRDAKGLLLDVGCGDPEQSRKVFPASVDYVGLDPHPKKSDAFSICGFAEALPFQNESVDTVVFNTSLDHVLDDHGAVEEAWRVLKPGGEIYLVTLIWHKQASLMGDTAHFHHFREWEIKGLFEPFEVHRFMKVNWKDNDNRFGIYMAGRKQR